MLLRHFERVDVWAITSLDVFFQKRRYRCLVESTCGGCSMLPYETTGVWFVRICKVYVYMISIYAAPGHG